MDEDGEDDDGNQIDSLLHLFHFRLLFLPFFSLLWSQGRQPGVELLALLSDRSTLLIPLHYGVFQAHSETVRDFHASWWVNKNTAPKPIFVPIAPLQHAIETLLSFPYCSPRSSLAPHYWSLPRLWSQIAELSTLIMINLFSATISFILPLRLLRFLPILRTAPCRTDRVSHDLQTTTTTITTTTAQIRRTRVRLHKRRRHHPMKRILSPIPAGHWAAARSPGLCSVPFAGLLFVRFCWGLHSAAVGNAWVSAWTATTTTTTTRIRLSANGDTTASSFHSTRRAGAGSAASVAARRTCVSPIRTAACRDMLARPLRPIWTAPPSLRRRLLCTWRKMTAWRLLRAWVTSSCNRARHSDKFPSLYAPFVLLLLLLLFYFACCCTLWRPGSLPFSLSMFQSFNHSFIHSSHVLFSYYHSIVLFFGFFFPSWKLSPFLWRNSFRAALSVIQPLLVHDLSSFSTRFETAMASHDVFPLPFRITHTHSHTHIHSHTTSLPYCTVPFENIHNPQTIKENNTTVILRPSLPSCFTTLQTAVIK